MYKLSIKMVFNCKRASLIFLLTLLLGLLAGCGDAAPTISSAASSSGGGSIFGNIGSVTTAATTTGRADPTTIQAATTPLDLCRLVTQAEAEAILGQPLQPLKVESGLGCTYRALADAGKKSAFPIVSVLVTTGVTKGNIQTGANNLANVAKITPKPENGLGDFALNVDGILYILKGDKELVVSPYDTQFDQTKIRAFAVKALGQL